MSVTTDRPAPATGGALPRALARPAAAAGLLVTGVLLVLACAAVVVPMLDDGLLTAAPATYGTAGNPVWDLDGTPWAVLADHGLGALVWLVFLGVFAVAPVLGLVGAVTGAGAAVAQWAARRWWSLAASVAGALLCSAVLALALTPLWRTAKAWFLD